MFKSDFLDCQNHVNYVTSAMYALGRRVNDVTSAMYAFGNRVNYVTSAMYVSGNRVIWFLLRCMPLEIV